MIPQRTAKVIPLRPRAGTQISAPEHPSPFDKLTAKMVLDQYRRGVLPEAVVEALLAVVGLEADAV
jgi:hypothetical protein